MKVDNITLMMFVLNFVEFCFILELIYSSDFHEGRQYFMLMLVLTINMQLAPSACGVQCSTERLVTTVTSQVHSARHHQRAGYSALPSV